MPCDPLSDANFNTSPPSPSIGGFAPQIPDLNIPFGDLAPDDLFVLFNALTLYTPIGIMKAGLDPDVVNNSYQGISDLFKKLMPYLMLYKFFLPMLNLILCIIEVLCALNNPFKMIKAIRTLFRVCLPEFLALFPFFALAIIIISILQLILSLIQYLIGRIIQMILIIINNIITLEKSISRLDNDSIISIVKKIGDLLCLMQNLFVIFGIILVFIQVIQTILSVKFRIPPCSDSDSDSCCTPDVCPDFIKNNSDITSSDGYFQYFNEVGKDSGLSLPPGFPPIVAIIRQESWQFYDPSLSQRQAFINISNAYDLPPGTTKVFFPGGATYDKTTSPSSTPYTINFRLLYTPSVFGKSDPKGARFIKIKNAIVKNPPTSGVASFDGTSTTTPTNGTLNLVGGIITEDDGTSILDPQGNTISLNDFFHMPINMNGQFPLITDGALFSNITYTFTINHEILLGAGLITLGCVPEVAIDKNFINATIGGQFTINGQNLGNIPLPDILVSQSCITNAITNYRNGGISKENTLSFQTTILNCLNDLQTNTSNALVATIKAGFDQFKSDFSIDPTIQFTSLPIKVSVSLNENSGNLMTNNLSPDAAANLASQISGIASFGDLSSFTYDGSQFFIANITSKASGNGTIEIAFNNNLISILNNPSDITKSPTVSIKQLNYTFVQSATIDDGKPRRDFEDISREGN